MRRSSMKCRTCVKFEETECRLAPKPVKIKDPDKHWCSQGQWHEWSDRYQEIEPYYWGEWEEEM